MRDTVPATPSAVRAVPIRRVPPDREATRITLARVLELGVRVSWREAAAIVHEAIAASGGGEGTEAVPVTAEACLLTRGGDVMLTGPAARARPEVVVRLLDDLLASCDEPGRFAGAVADGTALEMIEELSQSTSPKRRRVEVASVALRGLVAAADAARALADAVEQHPPAGGAAAVVPPAPVTAPPSGRRPWPPASAPPPPSPAIDCHAVGRRRPAARAGLVLVVAAGGTLLLPLPSTQRSAVEPASAVAPPVPIVDTPPPAVERSEPAIPAPQTEVPVAFGDQDPGVRPEPVRLTDVDDPPPVAAVATRPAPRESPVREAPVARTMNSLVPPSRPPISRAETPAQTRAPIAASRSRTAPFAAAPRRPSDPPPAAGARPPAAEPPSVVVSPSTPVSSTAEPADSGTTDVAAGAVPPAAGGATETRAIEHVLARYRTAFNELDAGAASAVWPTVNERTLAKAFERLASHELFFEDCEIAISSARADAACSGRARYVPKVGSRVPRVEPRRWTFSLRKAGEGWLIDRVEAR